MSEKSKAQHAERLLERNAELGNLPVRKVAQLMEATGKDSHKVTIDGATFVVTKEA